MIIHVHWSAKRINSEATETIGIRSYLGDNWVDIPQVEADIQKSLFLTHPELFADGAIVNILYIGRKTLNDSSQNQQAII